MIAAAITALMVAQVAWRRRATPGSRYLFWLMVAVAIYAFAAAFEIAASSIPAKIRWSKVEYLGTVSIAPLWLLMTLDYSQRKNWLTRPRVALLWLVPTLIWALVLTNERHSLIWTSFTPSSSAPGAWLIYGHGTAFWLHVAYAYLLMLIATYWLVRTSLHSPSLYRRQMGVLLVAAVLPWLANILTIFNMNPFPGLDLMPLAFVVSGGLLITGIYQFSLFDLMPVAYEVVFDNMADGVVVLDQHDRLVSLNATARRWMGLGDDAIGSDLFAIQQFRDVTHKFADVVEVKTRLEFDDGENHHVLDLTISPLRNRRGRLQGRVALLHDMSREQALLDTEQRRAAQLAALHSVSQIVVSSLKLEQVLESVVSILRHTFGYRYVNIYLLRGNTLYLGAQVGYPKDSINREIPATRGMQGQAVQTRQPQFIRKANFDAEFLGPGLEIASKICVPLLKEQTILGTLNIESPSQDDLTEADMQLLITFASQAAVAIENANLYSDVQRLAILDELTEVYNRRGLMGVGQLEWERAERYQHPLAALFLDVDHFKLFNDTYGYPFGDQVLRQLARCVRANLREVDVLGRYGGEEFVVILPEADLQSALEVAERLRHSVELMPIKTDWGETHCTVSIGVSVKNAGMPGFKALIECAGEMVHKAKQKGRNRVAAPE